MAVRVLDGRLPELLAYYGDRTFVIPRGDTMYRTVFLDDEYEASCSHLVRAWVRPGDCVVDVGANHGWFSLLMATVVGSTGIVVASEPMPRMLTALTRNLALNSHLDVRVLSFALGSEAGELTLHMFAGLSHGHASVSNLGRSDYVRTTTPVETFDSALGALTPEFVKLDVEGAELDVLRGAEATLRGAHPPTWLVEVNYETSRAMGFAPADLHSYVASLHDYDVYRVVEGGLIPENDLNEAPHGSSWLFVAERHRERLRSVPILAAGTAGPFRTGQASHAGA